MKKKCSKCKTVDHVIDQVIEFGEIYNFCKICSVILSKNRNTGQLKNGFLMEDFGKFPVTDVEKNIINARIDRASGKLKWSN